MWKDIDEDIAIKQVIKWSKPIKNMDQTLQFMSDIVNQEMPSDKPLWEYHLVEDYTKDSSMLIVRMSHSFTDAMGIVSMLSCLNDEGYKLKIDKELPKQGLIQNILLILAAIPLSISFMTATKNMPTDEKAAKIREFNGENQHKIKFYVSKSYSFEAVKKCYKRYDQTTFNDYYKICKMYCITNYFNY